MLQWRRYKFRFSPFRDQLFIDHMRRRFIGFMWSGSEWDSEFYILHICRYVFVLLVLCGQGVNGTQNCIYIYCGYLCIYVFLFFVDIILSFFSYQELRKSYLVNSVKLFLHYMRPPVVESVELYILYICIFIYLFLVVDIILGPESRKTYIVNRVK